MNKNQYSLTILLPVIDEYISLKKTIKILEKENSKFNIFYIFIIHPKKSLGKSINLCKEYIYRDPIKFSLLFQKEKLLGGAYIDGINASKGSHILIMSSDLETDPYHVKTMINESIKNTNKIICTSRWLIKNSFKDYGLIKTSLNKIFQILVKFCFNYNLTDYTFGFRLYPSQCLKNHNWQMRNHSFFLEIILQPLKKGYGTIELSAKWNRRDEGVSNNKAIYYLSYFKVIILFLLQKN